MSAPIILLALDGSERALVSLPIAQALARLEEGSLHIVHVSERSLSPAELLARIGIERDDVRGAVLDPRCGEPPEAILRAASEAETHAIVLSTYTGAAKARPGLGATALGVMLGARCPIVFVHPERGARPWSVRRLLLPHDGTPTTSKALRPAAELARLAGAELWVLNVAGPEVGPPPGRGVLTAPRYVDHPQHEWPSWAEEFLERLASICPLEGLHVRMALACGRPGEAILRFAREHEIDLIVLAWRGEWDAGRAATLKTVAENAPCPTMIVRT